ncbi:MAG: hypothetical protein KAJ44_01210 [Thermoplasmatales archaeon]|nr:hypothetical protein [Thermoplasmatales archaeon]
MRYMKQWITNSMNIALSTVGKLMMFIISVFIQKNVFIFVELSLDMDIPTGQYSSTWITELP